MLLGCRHTDIKHICIYQLLFNELSDLSRYIGNRG